MVCGQKVVHVLRSVVLDEPQVPLGNGMFFLEENRPPPQLRAVLLPTKQALIFGVCQFERSHIHNAQNTLDQNATNQTLAFSTVSVCVCTPFV